MFTIVNGIQVDLRSYINDKDLVETLENNEDFITAVSSAFEKELSWADDESAGDEILETVIQNEINNFSNKAKFMHEHNIEILKDIPFMERTGAEQEALRGFWFSHPKETSVSVWDFMGMTQEDYRKWELGELKLKDGSYHEMEPSFFHIPNNVVESIRSEIASKEMLERNRLFTAFLNNVMPENSCSGYLCPTCDWAMIYDPGDDLVAIVSMDDIMYKEDFAAIMKSQGMKATETNFDKVWDALASYKSPDRSLRDNAQNFVRLASNPRPKLAEQIQSASARAENSTLSTKARTKGQISER